MTIALGIFVGTFIVLFYIYIGYPILLWLWAKIAQKNQEQGEYEPKVSIIVAAFNEETYIADKIKNSIEQDYPKEKIQLVVVSDGSSDNTMKIAENYRSDRVILIEVPERKGKAHALCKGMDVANGEVLVFTDANVFFDRNAIKQLVKPLIDPSCGAVSGVVDLQAMNTGEPLGEGAYMKYERFMQARESDVHTMVGTDGGMFAIRSELANHVPHEIILDDFYLVIKIAEKGYRIKYQPEARATEVVPASVEQEFRRKTRIAAGGFQILSYLQIFQHPIRNAKLIVLFLSHKLLRWLSPFFLIGMFVSNIILIEDYYFSYLLWIQVTFYMLACVGVYSKNARTNLGVYVPYYFVVVNLAFLIGAWRYYAGIQKVTWSRVDR